MTDRYLFKAKRKESKEWVQGCYMECPMAGSDGTDSCIVKLDGQVIVVDRDTLCQFTGLYVGTKWEDLTEEEKQTFYEDVCSEDGKSIKYQNVEDVKHLWKGKKIWENDVVRDVDEDMIMVVRWDEEKLRFVLDYYGIKGCLMEYGWDECMGEFGVVDTYGFDDFCSPINETLEVIGTTFDNPELLGG